MTSFDPVVLCRPALPADRDQVMEFLQDIWQGEDYVPGEWEIWLFQEAGCLGVAELDGQVVGVGHLLNMGHGEWWLEGLRVQPDFWGQGIGSKLHDFFVDRWLKSPGRVVRLATHNDRKPVHLMCERTGFEAIAEFCLLTSELQPRAAGGTLASPLEPDWAAALGKIKEGSLCFSLAGLMDFQWRFASPRADRLSGSSDDRLLEGEAGEVYLVRLDDDQDDAYAHLLASSCPSEKLTAGMKELCDWAASSGMSRLQWLAPNDPEILNAAQEAGFTQSEVGALIIFERQR